jgi:4-alpha-glucanotransferase
LSIDEEVRFPDVDAERINIPANPNNYWGYRMHLNIEDLIANTSLSARISKLIADNDRA